MANTQRNFVLGKMNKSLDERLVPNGQYVDALNVRLGSTEASEVGSVETTKGNTQITNIQYDGEGLSPDARCIGALEDGANETIYWFITDPSWTGGSLTGKLDLIVSFDTQNNLLTYHVISVDDGSNLNTTLNFNSTYVITGVSLIDDLLFFTDDYNPPRFINVNRNYPNPSGGVDGVSAESLLVIKRPPAETIGLQTLPTTSEDNFLEDRFVCFAYRWKYEDNEYSATSQFTDPAFIPKPFNYDFATSLNNGMLNQTNLAQLTYNSGGQLVVGIDLLWKDMQTGNIRIIEKLDKEKLGLVDNTNYLFSFSSSKIFSVLPETEILRLYDNVPRLAKAQTLMGNRLMYGNYLEQYDLVDAQGFPTKLEYTVELFSEEIGLEDVSTVFVSGDYNIDTPQTYPASVVTLQNVDSLSLKAGSIIEFQLRFEHQSPFTGDLPFPTQTTPDTEINFAYILPQDFGSAYELATSTDFVDKIGTTANIQTVANCGLGTTLTDFFNCSVLNTLDTLSKYESGIDTVNQPIEIITSPTSPDISFQLPAMSYVDDPTGVAITQTVYEYYEITFCEATFSEIGNPKSLHSDRSYEIGIIYMDDFNRATTSLVSRQNSLEVPCSASDLANRIQVDIPITQKAPSWATNYKFCIKADKEKYFNIYSQLFFRDPVTGADYFLLEGQNSRKAEEGDLLTVKSDTEGALSKCVRTSILEKKSQLPDFLDPAPKDDNGNEIKVPGGVYAKMRANNFATEIGDNPVVSFGELSNTDTSGDCSLVRYPVTISNPDFDSSLPESPTNPSQIDYTIPAGSRINIRVENLRKGKSCTLSGIERRFYLLDTTLIASQDYANFEDWWTNDNVQSILNGTSVVSEADCGESPPTATYITPQLLESVTGSSIATQSMFPCDLDLYFQFFFADVTSQARWLNVVGLTGYKGKKKEAKLSVKIEVLRSNSLCVFETKPSDASPDIWYESSQTFPVIQGNDKCQFTATVIPSEPSAIQFDYTDLNGLPASIIVEPGTTTTGVLGFCGSMVVSPSTPPVSPIGAVIGVNFLPEGAHGGNVRNQTSIDSAIINTSFFNCYSFGNGVESYQIRDSIDGKELLLGNRVFTTIAEEYKEVRRFADITYSGVYTDDTNLNKLNEFNLGLLNYKTLEDSYGPIYIIDGRETDILTLQEDKISYVTVGKNILTDAVGGGAITSVPEVLGQQVARIEEFGISQNPESYTKWGMNKYFTDAKRGAVIQLKGSSAANESLTVISEQGMRSWFRDLFINSFNTQKLGGFDPYMNEYVLSSNNQFIPQTTKCIECGITRTLTLDPSEDPITFCVDVGSLVGEVNIDYNIISISDTVKIDATYDSTTVTTGFVNNSTGSPLNVNKDKVSEDSVDIVVEATGSCIIEITVNCPDAQEITIVQVCYSLDNDAGEYIHNEYRWVDGAFTSPLHSEQVELVSGTSVPLVSQYSMISGPQGAGFIPADSATVSIISNKISPIDDYVFDSSVDELKYLRSNTLYTNTTPDMLSLLAASNNATPITGGPNTYEAAFSMPNTNEQYLYLIYDYRRPTSVDLCFDATSLFSACCDCTLGSYYIDAPTLAGATAVFTDVEMTIPATDGYYSDESTVREQIGGLLGIAQICPECVLPCGSGVNTTGNQGTYELTFNAGSDIGCTIMYFQPFGIPDGIRVKYNTVTYNELTSPTEGYLASEASPNNYTFVGNSSNDCGIGAQLASGGYSGLNQYVFNGTTFDLVGTAGTVTGANTPGTGDVQLTTSNPGYCTIYIPKNNITPEEVLIEMTGVCSGTAFDLEINCPVELVGVPTSNASPGACLTEPLINTYYNVPNRGGQLGYPEVNEFFVQDNIGNTRVPAGDYAILSGDGSRYEIAVDSNGVITSKTLCT